MRACGAQRQRARWLQVLKIIREGGKAHAVLDFVRSFMDRDAEHFALRCMRSMIAESEIAKLRRKHNVAASARV